MRLLTVPSALKVLRTNFRINIAKPHPRRSGIVINYRLYSAFHPLVVTVHLYLIPARSKNSFDRVTSVFGRKRGPGHDFLKYNKSLGLGNTAIRPCPINVYLGPTRGLTKRGMLTRTVAWPLAARCASSLECIYASDTIRYDTLRYDEH